MAKLKVVTEWDGTGRPPSREAALAWAKKQGLSDAEIARLPKSGTLTSLGDAVRIATADLAPGSLYAVARDLGVYRPYKGGSLALYDAEMKAAVEAAGGTVPASGGGGGGGSRSSSKGQGGATKASGGKATTREKADAEQDDTFGPIEGLSSRGAPLWPVTPLSPDAEASLAGKTVIDRSRVLGDSDLPVPLPGLAAHVEATLPVPLPGLARGMLAPDAYGQRIKARYYEDDILDPIFKWSEEEVDALKRIMREIGLYGNRPESSGRGLNIAEQEMYRELLAAANVNGVTWKEQLAEWRRRPPQDIIDALNGGPVSVPPIAVSSPAEIQQTARGVSQSLVGKVDRGMLDSVTSAYQGLEAAVGATRNVAMQAGVGEVYTETPSISAFVDDRLRREHPIEVDGYQFLTQFNDFMRMLGVG